jgi:hypothetical protein
MKDKICVSFVLILAALYLGVTWFVGAQAMPTPTILPDDPGPVLPGDRDYWGMPDGTFISYNIVAGGEEIAIRTCTLDPSIETFRLLCTEDPVILNMRAWRWVRHRVNKTMGKQWR